MLNSHSLRRGLKLSRHEFFPCFYEIKEFLFIYFGRWGILEVSFYSHFVVKRVKNTCPEPALIKQWSAEVNNSKFG